MLRGVLPMMIRDVSSLHSPWRVLLLQWVILEWNSSNWADRNQWRLHHKGDKIRHFRLQLMARKLKRPNVPCEWHREESGHLLNDQDCKSLVTFILQDWGHLDEIIKCQKCSYVQNSDNSKSAIDVIFVDLPTIRSRKLLIASSADGSWPQPFNIMLSSKIVVTKDKKRCVWLKLRPFSQQNLIIQKVQGN